MRRLLFVLVFVACDLPTQDDVRKAADDAIDECRTAIEDLAPSLVTRVADVALVACGALQREADDTQALVERSAHIILENLGCTHDGETWDCSHAALICGK